MQDEVVIQFTWRGGLEVGRAKCHILYARRIQRHIIMRLVTGCIWKMRCVV